MKYEIKKHGFSYVLIITDYVRLHKLKIGDILELKGINRVSFGPHPHNKQKPQILK